MTIVPSRTTPVRCEPNRDNDVVFVPVSAPVGPSYWPRFNAVAIRELSEERPSPGSASHPENDLSRSRGTARDRRPEGSADRSRTKRRPRAASQAVVVAVSA
jgi:hypothetical protein